MNPLSPDYLFSALAKPSAYLSHVPVVIYLNTHTYVIYLYIYFTCLYKMYVHICLKVYVSNLFLAQTFQQEHIVEPLLRA